MKKVLTATVLALTGLIAASAMAAPDYRNDDRRYSYAYGQNHQDQRFDHNRYDQQRWNDSRVNPSRQWRVGQTLPHSFDSSRYKVSDREARRLPNTGRYQQWYKVNGDYVLVNERSNRILRILG
ncbi:MULTISPECIES: RcnB family protein [Acinetobacter]|uniref:RcnB family protein n=2 Tax=Acinetobacter TaxID=469 RepID=A0A4Q7B053_9GAMM|nr:MULTISPECIES: RcnB family protein [Acinetobacter]MCW8038378.1 RcnB family protein [Acinetobacter entericus]RZG68292.1 hypothetical protein EXE25_04355 [Acinetobacter bouvetii]TCB70421.1 hypothetical protein E0H91_18035 [Acinetobacter sp. ANC 4177]